jgi:hypothetical protein
VEVPQPQDRPPDLTNFELRRTTQPYSPNLIDAPMIRQVEIKFDPRPSDFEVGETRSCSSNLARAQSERMLPEHGPGPPNMQVNMVTIETENGNEFDQIMTKKELQEYTASVRTMHKRKDKKVLPANVPLPDGINPGGGINSGIKLGSSAKSTGKVVPRGSRLTPERLAKMKIGTGFLTEPEKQLFIDILFMYEGAIAFDDSEMGCLNPEIEPPVVIHTVPHSPWQQQSLRLPKAMQEAATELVKERLKYGIYEFSQGPYRSRYFLVEKKGGTWRLVNDVQLLNKVTIRDSGMPPAVDEFSEDFAGYPIT